MTFAERVAADATRLAAHNARLRESRIAARAAAGLPPIHGWPAAPLFTPAPTPAPALPAPAPSPAKTAAEIEFDHVKAAALARIAAEEAAQAEEDAAVASIINSRAAALAYLEA